MNESGDGPSGSGSGDESGDEPSESDTSGTEPGSSAPVGARSEGEESEPETKVEDGKKWIRVA